jgi:hypothetical protein
LKFRYGRQPAASTCAAAGQTLAFDAPDSQIDPVSAEKRLVLGAHNTVALVGARIGAFAKPSHIGRRSFS